ncbi:MAG: hypothetical protein KDI82_06800 [Gammaproteobacteria bacterium]|nr:hypothetical protein [Gammaproteobacteria bacterium]
MSIMRALFMLLAYAGGLGWTAYELQRAPEETVAVIEPTQGTAFDIPQPLVLSASLDSYNAIIERPLFNERRLPETLTNDSPKAAADMPVTQPSASISGLRVSAIFRSAETLTALVELGNGSSRTVHAGEQLEGWEILEIQDDRLVMGNRGERRVLQVYDFERLQDFRTRTTPPPLRRSEPLAQRSRMLRTPLPRRRLPPVPPVQDETLEPAPTPGKLD